MPPAPIYLSDAKRHAGRAAAALAELPPSVDHDAMLWHARALLSLIERKYPVIAVDAPTAAGVIPFPMRAHSDALHGDCGVAG